MPQVVILHWERRRLSGVIAEGDAASVQVRQIIDHVWPDGFDPLQAPDQAAAQLRHICEGRLSSAQRVIVCLSRDEVILRHLDVPDVADEELPDLVRYQAAARSTMSLDQLLLDFLPLPKLPDHEGRSVLAVTVPKSLIMGIRRVLSEAGLEPAAITFSSIGQAEFIAHVDRSRGERSSHAVLAAFRDENHIELVIVAANNLIYAHRARLTNEDAAASSSALLAEISRTIVAAQRVYPQLRTQHAYLCGLDDEIPEIGAALSERLGVPVESIAPTHVSALRIIHADGAVGRMPFPATVGLALAEMNRLTPSCDFLHPRQPPAKVNQRKLQLAVGAAAALLIGMLFFGSIEWTRSSLQRQIAALDQQEKDLDFKIKPGLTALNAAGLVEQWQAGNRNQLEEMSALEDLMEGTDRMYLSQYSFTVGQGDVLGNLQASGNAKSRDDILQFHQRLTDTKSYRIQPRQLTQSGNDDEYPHRFELHAELLPPKTAPTLNSQPSILNP